MLIGIVCRKANVAEFIIDETQLKVGSEITWLGVSIEPKNKEILSTTISKERNMFVVERFLFSLKKGMANT
ncbi:MAG TPA: hypothetical protein VIY08_09120 [Candidatus Nitrosocosmicus sp.]